MKKNEEIQMRCNMMGDYMSYVGEGEKEEDGSKETFNHLRKKMLEVEELYEKGLEEEDETREPRPDESEEYWKLAKCWDCKFYNKQLYACLFHDAYVPKNDNCSHFEVLKDSNPEKYEAIIAEKIIKDSQILLYYALNKRHEKYYKQLADNIIMFQATMDNFAKKMKEEVK